MTSFDFEQYNLEIFCLPQKEKVWMLGSGYCRRGLELSKIVYYCTRGKKYRMLKITGKLLPEAKPRVVNL